MTTVVEESASRRAGLDRVGSVVQVLSGAVGIGAYIALAGGIAHWARMTGAGLPAAQALPAIDPITLLADGFQTLVFVPITVGAVLATVRIAQDVSRSPKELRAVVLARRGVYVLTQVWIVFIAWYAALMLTLFVFAAFVRASGSDVWVAVVAALTVLSVPLLMVFAAWWPLRNLDRDGGEDPAPEADAEDNAVRSDAAVVVDAGPAAPIAMSHHRASDPGAEQHRMDVQPDATPCCASNGDGARGRDWPAARATLHSVAAERPEVVATLPPVVRWPLLSGTEFSTAALATGSALTAVCAGVLVIAGLNARIVIGDIRLERLPAGIVLGALGVLSLVYTVVGLGITGTVWLRGAVARAQKTDAALRSTGGTADGASQTEGSSDGESSLEAHEQANLSFWMAVLLVGAAVLLPISFGVSVVGLVAIVLFAREFQGETNVVTRSIVLSLYLALGIMSYQGHSPQRFDLLTVSVASQTGAKATPLRLALIGTRGDAYVVAACDRKRFEVFGETRWKSSHPVLLRLPVDRAVDPEITSGKYTFLQDSEPSLIGALASALDLGLPTIPHPAPSANLYGWSGRRVTRDVCGGIDNSAVRARRAIAALSAAPRS